jgi:hypothetical protein
MEEKTKIMAQPAPVKTGNISAATRKVFLRPDDAPAFPIFINAVEFSAIGMDLLMDGGVVSPESVNEAQAKLKEGGNPPLLDVHVIFRAAMSFQTATLMHQRLGELLGKTQEFAAGSQKEAKHDT